MTTYRLGSAPMLSAPGVIRWAVDGGQFESDRPQLIEIISKGWHIPEDAARKLVTREVAFTVEGETVVFEA